MTNFLKSLIIVSEKAANIARACRSEKELFSLLVEEKKGTEGNVYFFQDFKTLADVLVQETVRYDLAKQFPALRENIKGEESNKFSNTLNTTITIEVKETFDETTELLMQVLDGDKRAAELLANEVHRNIDFDQIYSNNKDIPNIDIDTSNIGIWIDPIDATNEYVKGKISDGDIDKIHENGLQCVTVLIGAFDKRNGLPIAGVVNQPFYNILKNGRWRGKCYWGYHSNDFSASSEKLSEINSNLISMSHVDNNDIECKLREQGGFNIIKPAGAGYKILNVCTGLVDGYVLTKDSIFKWDTCATHAILKSLGGNVIEFHSAFDSINSNKEITYDKDFYTESKNIQIWRHANGVIAYKSLETLTKIMSALKNH